MSKELDKQMKEILDKLVLLKEFNYYESGTFDYKGKKYNMIIEEVTSLKE